MAKRVHGVVLVCALACGRVGHEDNRNGGQGGHGAGGRGDVIAGGSGFGGLPSSDGGGFVVAGGPSSGGMPSDVGQGGAAGAGASCAFTQRGSAPTWTPNGAGGSLAGATDAEIPLFGAGAPGFEEAGAGGGGSLPNWDVALGESSWDAEVELTYTGGSSSIACSKLHFTMRFSGTGSELAVAMSSERSGTTAKLLWDEARQSYRSVEPWAFPGGSDCKDNVFANEFELHAIDETGDDKPDYIRASGSAGATRLQATDGPDAPHVEYSFELRARLDRRPPALLVPVKPHPFEGVAIYTSELLSSSSSVSIVRDGERIDLQGTDWGGFFPGLVTFSRAVILPLGSVWTVEATGTDLAGLKLVTPPQLEFMEEPGVYQPDGFESAPRAILRDGATRVNGLGKDTNAIAGCWSLWVPIGGHATLHLARAANQRNVVFRARMVPISGAMFAYRPPVEVGVVGGTHVTLSGQAFAPALVQTNDPTLPYVTEIQEFAIPLTDSGSDVLVRIKPSGCAFSDCRAAAILVDDLRLE